ncbi:MAG: hypothetical protein EOP54_22775, partial [Sphingobacteriales bacterium]
MSAKAINQTTIELVFNELISATSLANFTGIAGLNNITQTDGATATTLLLNYSTPFAIGTSYNLIVDGIEDTGNNPMFGAYTFNFSYNTTISFNDVFLSVDENIGVVNINLSLTNPSAGSVDLVLKAAPFSNTDASDITYTT